MNYLRSVVLREQPQRDLYLNDIPAVQQLIRVGHLDFPKPVTVFVGENGTGKSTILEAIAIAMGFNAEGGGREHRFSTQDSHSELWRLLSTIKTVTPDDGFFLRAESFYNTSSYIDQSGSRLGRYGYRPLHTRSHGEAFLALVQNRFEGHGLYLLDEPEAALSPQRLLSLLVAMHDLVELDSQFIVATHSPIVMAFPGADIKLFDENGIHTVDYRETDHYQITKQFINDPDRMLNYLFSNDWSRRRTQMETINGEWYMKGCAKDDPNRLHTVEDAAALVQKIGFLPLFSNDIPGFSVEERTLAADWWKDDPTRDPWAWRQILSRHPRIIYGKFYDRRAGFVSTDWFPTFANYRRNGYDFDTLIDEGLAPQRHRKLMQPYLTDGLPNGTELHSFALKAQAGFGKGGEKNFEGTLTELEMQSYLCIGDFRQRTNKKGQLYGWHIAIITPPETKLGYDRIAEAYREAPENSWRRITEQIQSFFQEATDDQLLKLQKLLGIRR